MSVFTLLIDVDNKQLLANRFGGVGSLPNFDRGDTPNIEIGFLKYNGIQYDFVMAHFCFNPGHIFAFASWVKETFESD